MTLDPNVDCDFGSLVHASLDVLLITLAEVHSNIANLTLRVGFLKQEELRGVTHAKTERIGFEALRDAYVEEKWLIKAVLEHGK
jgi:hypothetical protein